MIVVMSIAVVVVGIAVAVGIGGGNSVGVGLSGAGVYTENKIRTDVKAYISGDGADGISANSVHLLAKDSSGIDTIAAGGATLRADDRQPSGAHVDRVQVAGHLAVRQSEAGPGATLSPPRHRGRGLAAREASILGGLNRDTAATRA